MRRTEFIKHVVRLMNNHERTRLANDRGVWTIANASTGVYVEFDQRGVYKIKAFGLPAVTGSVEFRPDLLHQIAEAYGVRLVGRRENSRAISLRGEEHFDSRVPNLTIKAIFKTAVRHNEVAPVLVCVCREMRERAEVSVSREKDALSHVLEVKEGARHAKLVVSPTGDVICGTKTYDYPNLPSRAYLRGFLGVGS